MTNGCADPSPSFLEFAFAALNESNVLPAGLSFSKFSACDYLPHLQQKLFSLDSLNENVTYANFVILPDALKDSLRNFLGHDNINGSMVSCSSLILVEV